MFTVNFPPLSHTETYHLYLVVEEKVIHVQAFLYNGRPLVLTSSADTYDVLLRAKDANILFAPSRDVRFSFYDIPNQLFDVDLSSYRPRTLYF